MLHSKWSEGHPQTSRACSSLRITGSSGFWYSVNCSDKHPVVCMTRSGKFIITKEQTSTTSPHTTTTIHVETTEVTSETYIYTTGPVIHDTRGNYVGLYKTVTEN